MIKKESGFYPLVLVVPALFVFTLFTIVPVLMSLTYSFTDWNIMRMDEPEFRGLLNYQRIFADPIFIRSMMNTLLFAFSTTALKTLFGLGLAVLLIKKVPGNGLFRTLFYLPCVLSATVIGVLFKAILTETGLLNNGLQLLGLGFLGRDWLSSYGTAMLSVIYIESWMWSGFNMMIFIAGLQAIPSDYMEVALIEGAGRIKRFFHVTLPLLIPAFTVVVTLSMAGGLRVFELVYVLTNGGPGFDTQVMNTYSFRAFSQGLLGESAAASIVLAAVVVTISFMLNRYLKSREVEL
ncbi:MAG: sugar ABC transporter permease [Spirochaetales bacterium]|nr:sugar ABC transporter permease [Spirochaetales bacterium]